MKYSLSLRQSAFATIIIASAFLLLTFIYLQLTNEADRTSKHQIRETYLSVLLSKETLESQFRGMATPSPKELTGILDELIQKKQVLHRPTLLLSEDGSAVYPPGSMNPAQATDRKRMEEILLTYDLTGEWFRMLPALNRPDTLDILIPIFFGGKATYFLKTTVTLDNLKTAFQRTYQSVIVIFLIVIGFASFVTYRVTRTMVNPIRQLSNFTEQLARGDLDQEVQIETGNEIEDLAKSFNQMAKQVAQMKSRAEDANALTHLPGNNVIAAEVTKRLNVGAKLAVVHTDLDRFKMYNDLYGLKRGDEVIKMTAEVLQEAVKEQGTRDDLVAHEGGDDFVIVTIPARLEQIAIAIIKKFDARVGNHYRSEDRDRGYIMIKDRRSHDPNAEATVQIPLMSISLAAVTNEKKSFPTYGAIATLLAETKKKAKSILGSSFVIAD